MTVQEASTSKELVITDLQEAKTIQKAGRYGLGAWLRDKEELGLRDSAASRTKRYIARVRASGDTAEELRYPAEEATLIIDNLWAAYLDKENSQRNQAAEMLKSVFGESTELIEIEDRTLPPAIAGLEVSTAA